MNSENIIIKLSRWQPMGEWGGCLAICIRRSITIRGSSCEFTIKIFTTRLWLFLFETAQSSDNYSPKIAFQVNYLHKNGNKSILNRSIGNDFLWKNSLSNPRKETLNLWKSISHPKQRSFNATVGTGTNPKYFTWQTGTTGRCGGNFLGNLRRHLLCLDVQNTNR